MTHASRPIFHQHLGEKSKTAYMLQDNKPVGGEGL